MLAALFPFEAIAFQIDLNPMSPKRLTQIFNQISERTQSRGSRKYVPASSSTLFSVVKLSYEMFETRIRILSDKPLTHIKLLRPNPTSNTLFTKLNIFLQFTCWLLFRSKIPEMSVSHIGFKEMNLIHLPVKLKFFKLKLN